LTKYVAPNWKPVAALGVTQIIGYGTLYYAYALAVPAVAVEFGVSEALLFGVFSIGLLVAGFAAPRVGRQMDAVGAPKVMAVGSGLAGIALALVALSPNLTSFTILIVIVEFIALTVLYDAAFATLTRMANHDARRQITRLTLIAGFASTVFWPLTSWLVKEIGWRETYAVFAILHVLVALPLHVWLARAVLPDARKSHAGEPSGHSVAPSLPFHPLPAVYAPKAFLALAISFALSGFVISAMSVHMVSILHAAGLASSATMIAMLMGPSQVVARVVEALAGNRFHPLWTALFSTAALPLAVVLIMLPLPVTVAGAAFVVMSGIGQGLSSIVRGTVPLALFGADGFGGLLGRLAMARTMLSAGAPFLFALTVAWLGQTSAQFALVVIGTMALLPLPFLIRMSRRN
jgi:MFS family permease